jgi:hypothetical protein
MPEQTAAATGASSTSKASTRAEERVRADDRARAESRPEITQTIGAGLPSAPARDRYLLGTFRDAQVGERDFEQLLTNLSRDPNAHVEQRSERTIVAQLTPDLVERTVGMIRANPALAGVLLELDASLNFGGGIRFAQSSEVLSPTAVPVRAAFTVVGKNDEPIEGAAVSMLGGFGSARGSTDAHGRVEMTLLAEPPPTVEALQVRPHADYWSYWNFRPVLDLARPTTIRLARLDQGFPQFPNQALVGWGLKAMRLDQLSAEQYNGRGVRVALVGSGCSNRHRNLRHVDDGLDLSSSGSGDWTDDEVGLGTHCAGIIAGGHSSAGVRGIAPEAALLVLKTSREARVSELIDALDRSIERGADIVSITIGAEHGSVLLEQKIAQAKSLGIACIAGAGDSAGAVRSPAASPEVLAVSAVGWRAAFPSDSSHTLSIGQAGNGFDGYFVASFACAGPEVDLCGPGVAVVSSVPPDNFAAWDGTATAAAHVTGLAALVLAHHPDFSASGPYAKRDSQRVDRLFAILRASAQPFRIGDTFHSGFGLPDGPRALDATVPFTDEARAVEREASVMLRNLAEAAQRSAASPATTDLNELHAALARAGLIGPSSTTPPAAGEKVMADALRRAGLS